MSNPQIDALEAAAAIVDRADVKGIDVTVSAAGAISIQVLCGSPLMRVLTLAQLCAVLDVDHERYEDGGDPWRGATGDWHGVVVHVYAAITVAEQAELDQLAAKLMAGLEGLS